MRTEFKILQYFQQRSNDQSAILFTYLWIAVRSELCRFSIYNSTCIGTQGSLILAHRPYGMNLWRTFCLKIVTWWWNPSNFKFYKKKLNSQSGYLDIAFFKSVRVIKGTLCLFDVLISHWPIWSQAGGWYWKLAKNLAAIISMHVGRY